MGARGSGGCSSGTGQYGQGLRRGAGGSVAVAAADITAAGQGNPAGDLPENVADWVTATGPRSPPRMSSSPWKPWNG